MQAVPITAAKADRYIERWHRHHGKLPPGYAMACIAAVKGGEVVGVAVLGRPTNRNSDKAQILEILRVATNGHRNASSFLVGACGRIARDMGASKCITYTLDSESGSSLRAAGWKQEANGIQSWWQTNQSKGRTVKPREHYGETKTRWVLEIREPINVRDEPKDQAPAELLLPGLDCGGALRQDENV